MRLSIGVVTVVTVVTPPALDGHSGVGQAGEPALVQALVSEPPVEALGVRILHSFPELDEDGRAVGAIPPLDAAIAYAQAGKSAFFVALMKTIKGMALFVNGDAAAGRTLVEDARKAQARIGDYEAAGWRSAFSPR